MALFVWTVGPGPSPSIASADAVSVTFNGTFVGDSPAPNSKAHSPNGDFWCTYSIGRVGDEVRELEDFAFYRGDQLLYTMYLAPGSDLAISNAGITAFMDMTHHYRGEITLSLFSETGRHLLTQAFHRAQDFQFSPDGDRFGIRASGGLYVVTLSTGETDVYPGGSRFAFSEDGALVALASLHKISIYRGGMLVREIGRELGYPRKLVISSRHDMIAVIDKRNLSVFSLSGGDLLFSDRASGNYSFRDLLIDDGVLHAGVQYRGRGISEGIIRSYDRHGRIIDRRVSASRSFPVFHENAQTVKARTVYKLPDGYDPIPWPFVPFDQMHTVWNYHEQHMGYDSEWSYLHQGLDIIVPIAEPTYAVAPGIVKCVLTLGGDYYWRTAISPTQEGGWSDGWLYAHLIESTIQFDVGDTVGLHDYLGDIIEWSADWGHIHFVEISDTGFVWQYEDNEWGINFNPLRALEPDTDSLPPVIDDVFTDSKFGFCQNETSNYLDPDSLYGDIDIITKVVDYIGSSEWQQPAFETYYWVESLPGGEIVSPRTRGQMLNHRYPFYESGWYEPYATVIYKRDAILPPPYWEETERNFYHVLTNSDGDSLIDLSEKNLAFSTAQYPDGEYCIVVEVFDEYGNAALDSMDVRFSNDNTGVGDGVEKAPWRFMLDQNYPNPFNPTTTISYEIPDGSGEVHYVELAVFDIRGKLAKTLLNDEELESGRHSVVWDGRNEKGEVVPSGVYFYKLKCGGSSSTMKMTLIR